MQAVSVEMQAQHDSEMYNEMNNARWCWVKGPQCQQHQQPQMQHQTLDSSGWYSETSFGRECTLVSFLCNCQCGREYVQQLQHPLLPHSYVNLDVDYYVKRGGHRLLDFFLTWCTVEDEESGIYKNKRYACLLTATQYRPVHLNNHLKSVLNSAACLVHGMPRFRQVSSFMCEKLHWCKTHLV